MLQLSQARRLNTPHYKVKRVWSKCLQDQKKNQKLILCSKNALMLTDMVHLPPFWRLRKLLDLQ